MDNGGCSCLTGLRSPVWHRDWKQWYFLRFIVHSERTVLWTGLWLVVVQAVAYPDPMTSGISCEVRFQCTTSSAQPRSLRETPLFWFVLGFLFLVSQQMVYNINFLAPNFIFLPEMSSLLWLMAVNGVSIGWQTNVRLVTWTGKIEAVTRESIFPVMEVILWRLMLIFAETVRDCKTADHFDHQ